MPFWFGFFGRKLKYYTTTNNKMIWKCQRKNLFIFLWPRICLEIKKTSKNDFYNTWLHWNISFTHEGYCNAAHQKYINRLYLLASTKRILIFNTDISNTLKVDNLEGTFVGDLRTFSPFNTSHTKLLMVTNSKSYFHPGEIIFSFLNCEPNKYLQGKRIFALKMTKNILTKAEW